MDDFQFTRWFVLHANVKYVSRSSRPWYCGIGVISMQYGLLSRTVETRTMRLKLRAGYWSKGEVNGNPTVTV
jgi:hypothetical protein